MRVLSVGREQPRAIGGLRPEWESVARTEAMMGNEIQNAANPGGGELAASASYERCSYCGHALNHAFYFCTVCATPHRPISEIISPALPRPLTEGELIQKKVPNVWRVFWTYAIIIFVVGVVGHEAFDDERRQLFGLIFASVAILLTTVVFEIVFWRSLVVQLRESGLLKAETWIGFLLLALALLLNYTYHSFIVRLAGQTSPSESWLTESGLSPAAIFVLVCLLPGITEEIAFRGLIQHWLHTVLRPWRAIMLASALFTALHLSVVSAPYIFLLGMLLGWVKWKSRSLYPSILMHIVHNWIAVTVFPILLN